MEKDNSARVILSLIRHDRNNASFDKMTCHKKLYTSGDGKAIANHNVGSQFKRGGVFYKAYRGVLRNIAFKENSKGFSLKLNFNFWAISCKSSPLMICSLSLDLLPEILSRNTPI